MDNTSMKKAVIISSSGGVRRTIQPETSAVKELERKPSAALSKPVSKAVKEESNSDAKVAEDVAANKDVGIEPKAKPKDSKKKKGLLDGLAAKVSKVKHFDLILVGIFAVTAVLIFFGSSWFGGSKSKKNTDDYISASDYCAQTEARLKRILSSVKGAGNVDVMINFESTPERILAYIVSVNANKSAGANENYNETENRTESPQILNVNGTQVPLILKELAPKVIGIVIVSQGAEDIKTKLDLINAASVLMDVSKENIIVLTMNKAAR